MGDEGVGADHAVFADDGLPAQNRGTGVDGDIVLDGGVPLMAVQGVAFACRKGAQGDSLVDLHVVSDGRGRAHNDAGSVVDEEVFSDGGAGMDVDTGPRVGVFRHDSRNQGHIQ